MGPNQLPIDIQLQKTINYHTVTIRTYMPCYSR